MRLVALNALVLLGLLVIAEVTLRAIGWQPASRFSTMQYEIDPMAGPWHVPSQTAFVHAPCFEVDAVHVNRYGMRDRERTLAAAGLRIALVGDSFTEALQVPDDKTVSHRLEALLAGRAEVLNFGVSSTGTAVQLLNYRKRVRPFRPDVVLVMFFAGNDVEDNLPSLKRKSDPIMADVSPYLLLDADGVLNDTPAPGRFTRTSPLVRIVGMTVLGRWVYQAYQSMRVGAALTAVSGTADDSSQAADREAAWNITEQVLLRFHRDVTEDGARFGVVLIPGPDAAETQQVVERLTAVSRRGPFPVVDLAAVFGNTPESAADKDALSFPCDAHWNSRGHEKAAVALLAFLEHEQWLERRQ